MNDYDAVAPVYDEHFTRPVDAWEDDRLVRLLRPDVDGLTVVDLGCGTGWLLDHLTPHAYAGIDASAGMLTRLTDKHPGTTVVKAEVGGPGWWTALEVPEWWLADTVTATWSAHELGPPGRLLTDLRDLIQPGTIVVLHGQAPRYARRDHYVLDGDDTARGYLAWTPKACREQTPRGFRFDGATGTGALPDRLAAARAPWRAAAWACPTRWHYAFCARWERR